MFLEIEICHVYAWKYCCNGTRRNPVPVSRPLPYSKKVAGVCGDIPEGSKVRGDLALVTEQLPQPMSRNQQWVELSCTK